MSVTTENAPVQGQTTLQENRAGEGVYASLFEKINLAPASHLGDINDFLDDAALSEAPAAERLTAAMQVFMERIRQSGQRVEKLDKTLIDHHIAELDFQISRQLDAVMHHQEFQQVESLWRGLKQLVDNTDYLQQSWSEILEQADSTFSRGANHLWLDLQWYIHQALVRSGQDVLADIIIADLKGLLRRLTGLETLAFNDGTPFADEVTLNWINQSVLDDMSVWQDEPVSAASGADNDILALEPEALEKADTDGLDAALHWIQTRPGTESTKEKWLLRLLMARVAEQKGKNDLALYLLRELDDAAGSITLTQWIPALLFEIKSRRLRLLRMKATRSESEKLRLQPEMDQLLAGLIALDPASSAVLCG